MPWIFVEGAVAANVGRLCARTWVAASKPEASLINVGSLNAVPKKLIPIGKQNDHRRIEHGGEWQGFSCHIARYPEDNLTVVVVTNLASSNPSLIAQITAGLADPVLLPPKLTSIPDAQPATAALLAKLLDQLAAGEDTASHTTDGIAARILPDSKWVRHRLTNLWPGGTLTLVKRVPPDSPTGQSLSVFRLSKGDDAILIFIGSLSDGKISTLRTAPNREYDW